MGNLASLLRALGRDDRGVAVAEYGMIVTVVGGVVLGLMTLGTNVNDCVRTVGSLLMGLTGHYY